MWHSSAMKYALRAAVISGFALTAGESFTQGGADPNGAPNPYRLEDSWAKLPLGRGLGSGIRIRSAKDGRSIWVYDRCGGNTCEASKVAPLVKYDRPARRWPRSAPD